MGRYESINLLKSKMALYGDKQKDLAQKLEISETSLSKKMNETGKAEFTKKEMQKIKEIYDLTVEELNVIFFA